MQHPLTTFSLPPSRKITTACDMLAALAIARRQLELVPESSQEERMRFIPQCDMLAALVIARRQLELVPGNSQEERMRFLPQLDPPSLKWSVPEILDTFPLFEDGVEAIGRPIL